MPIITLGAVDNNLGISNAICSVKGILGCNKVKCLYNGGAGYSVKAVGYSTSSCVTKITLFLSLSPIIISTTTISFTNTSAFNNAFTSLFTNAF